MGDWPLPKLQIAVRTLLVLVSGVLLVQLAQQGRHPAVKVKDRLERLEATQDRLVRVVESMGTDLAQVDRRSEQSAAQLDRVRPVSAQWLELRGSAKAQWELGEHGRARVEVLPQAEEPELAGLQVAQLSFRITHRAGQITAALGAGETLRAVDDQGSRQVSYLVTLHRLRRDRSGRIDAALLSVSTED